jgi:hypothetical protein
MLLLTEDERMMNSYNEKAPWEQGAVKGYLLKEKLFE